MSKKKKTKRSKKTNRRRKSERRVYILITLILIAFIIFFVAAVCGSFLQGQNDGDTEENSAESDTVAFPWESDDGTLRITALVQFSGPNMDADNQEGEDIAGIQIENISDQYIEEAAVTFEMEDGQEYSFLIQDLPAGGQTVAFEQTSQTYDGETGCTEIACSTESEDTSLEEDRVSISTDGSKVTITNISEQQIDNATVIYRCSTGDSYIGGISYEITVSGLAAGESFEYEDSECLLGTPEAVGVEID